MSSIALVDCNNFFVSCERLFNPSLLKRPVVVLSNNDGCIISRSQEAKDLGIPMGAPLFQWTHVIHANKVHVCSSNYALYGDMSHRVMSTLAMLNPDIEIYSVDEAFLLLDKGIDAEAHCRQIRKTVLEWTGIPVSIGVGPTKTLAKVANRHAKKNPHFKGVCAPSLETFNTILNSLPVEDIWGIGRRLKEMLAKWGIWTAAQLRDQNDWWVRKYLSVTGLRTVLELRAFQCFSIGEEPAAKKTLITSRSFGAPVIEWKELAQAIAVFTAKCAEKMREENSLASWMMIFVSTDQFHGHQVSITLPEPTDYTPTLLTYAEYGIKSIYQKGDIYKRAGVMLGGLISANAYQPDLFVSQNPVQKNREKTMINLVDRANARFGYSILKFGAEGIERRWQSKRNLCSPCRTTRWDELLTIQI